MLDACSRFIGLGRRLAIYRCPTFRLTALGTVPLFSRSFLFFLCVTRIALRLSRFFDPCRQQLQIEKIHSLGSGRGHQFHLLEGHRKATSRCRGRARSHVGASEYTPSCHVECSRGISNLPCTRATRRRSRDLIRSPFARSAFGLSVHVAASRAAPFSASHGTTRITLLHARQAPEND